MAASSTSISARHPIALPPEAWLVAGLLGAVACAIAALFGDSAAFACAAVGSLAAGVAFYEPRTLGPMLALALPLEISKLAFPFLQTRSELGGGIGPTSIIDAGRLVVALAFGVWAIRPCRPRLDVLPATSMTLPLALLFAVTAVSSLWAIDTGAARTESMRLLFSLGTFALVPFFVRDLDSLRWTLLALVATVIALSILGIYQQITGTFFWNEGLGLYGERRINTTFADPNHFARFLLEGTVVAVLMWSFVGTRTRRYVLLPAIALALLTIVFTGSRSSWLIGAIALPVAVLALPIARTTRLRILAAGVSTLVIAAVAIAAFSPFFTKRINTFTFGVEASGARPYLVDAGMHMFEDNPVTGVGAGGYQRSFEDDYLSFKDPKIKANITISHTSLVTIAAELGAIGLVAIAFAAVRWALYARAVIRRTAPVLKPVAIALAVITAIILVASQSEGRFLEDPYLWLATGLVVAIASISQHARVDDVR